MKQRIREERGSVTAVFVALMAVLLVLVIGILDREWANYMLKLAEQSADLAAEAGASRGVRDVMARVQASRSQYVITWETTCIHKDVKGNCDGWTSTPKIVWIYDNPVLVRPEEEFRQDWRKAFGCSPDGNAQAPNWRCDGAELVAPMWGVFHPEAEGKARDTFQNNWHDRTRASVTNVLVQPVAANRMVYVRVSLQVDSLFNFVHPRPVQVTGAAIVQVKPLVFN